MLACLPVLLSYQPGRFLLFVCLLARLLDVFWEKVFGSLLQSVVVVAVAVVVVAAVVGAVAVVAVVVLPLSWSSSSSSSSNHSISYPIYTG